MMTAVVLPAVPRVLIAESDPWVRETLSDLVLSVRADVELEMCTDGKQAVEWMKKHLPDLVIAARELPGIDGLSLLRGVRNLRRQPAIPFILISNRNDSASVREVVPLAPTAYLTKPLNTEGLRHRLEGLLLEHRAPAPGEVPALAPGLTLSKFLEKRRDIADGAPLYVDVATAIKLSQTPNGTDPVLLEQELRNDPHITAVLVAAANSAAQHLGKPIQSLAGALTVLGPVQGANIASGLAKKRMAILTHDALLARASELWTMSQRTAEYARILGGMLELDVERCFCAGLLQSLGDLAVLGCLQEWLLAGGELNEQAIGQSLEQYSAAFGSALRTRWRLPLELRELIAAVYQYNTGIYTREVLTMNLAGQMARLGEEESVTALIKTKSAKLLKLSVGDLQRLRKKLTGVTDPSLLRPVAVEPEAAAEVVEDDEPDLLDLAPEPPAEQPAAIEDPGDAVQDVPKK
ncbi:HDOD domain-containing protein [Pseudomonas cannabina]|uniref:HDOD domain-containing protein n=4 Tax=Pseudomonas syringae group TaxID=136849 RepID=A0A8T8BV26_PSEYM|nr:MULTISPECIES: HDOD domain-containing protein [Pseudomonas syringae group]KPB69943.1 Response regulator [Pseudomonas syringae pv. maculicola]MBM0137673.1 HDOD domain-containing protein [Pseudomonas cannabina pv. alisalensis]QHE95285.1 HDOD domain-containing protein [Pseudomonas syringae pv. maculicola str. ES4326]QQN22256.1 HDOD domain-containing protein [Pseudomonas cannabina pv. alisalensis]RMN86551.1 Response regulator [Pseudomonas cannabina pv. alisalensis]